MKCGSRWAAPRSSNQIQPSRPTLIRFPRPCSRARLGIIIDSVQIDARKDCFRGHSRARGTNEAPRVSNSTTSNLGHLPANVKLSLEQTLSMPVPHASEAAALKTRWRRSISLMCSSNLHRGADLRSEACDASIIDSRLPGIFDVPLMGSQAIKCRSVGADTDLGDGCPQG